MVCLHRLPSSYLLQLPHHPPDVLGRSFGPQNSFNRQPIPSRRKRHGQCEHPTTLPTCLCTSFCLARSAPNQQCLTAPSLSFVQVAPVTEEGARMRDIFIPRGAWKDPFKGTTAVGPTWLRNYPAALDELPVFEKQDAGLWSKQSSPPSAY